MQTVLGLSPMDPIPQLPSPFIEHDADILKTSSGVFINVPEQNLVYWQPKYAASLTTLTPDTAYAMINACDWVRPAPLD